MAAHTSWGKRSSGAQPNCGIQSRRMQPRRRAHSTTNFMGFRITSHCREKVPLSAGYSTWCGWWAADQCHSVDQRGNGNRQGTELQKPFISAATVRAVRFVKVNLRPQFLRACLESEFVRSRAWPAFTGAIGARRIGTLRTGYPGHYVSGMR